MDILLPLVVIGLLGMTIIVIAARRGQPEEVSWLLGVLLIAFALRLAAATMFALVPSTRMFHEDAEGYEALGMKIAAGWLGKGPPFRMAAELTQNFGYYYVCAAIYWVFGACRVAPSYVNALLGTSVVLMVYNLARRFFHVVVARRAALLCAFIPSMILWSSMALKDTPMTFLIVIALASCVRLKERFTLGALVGTAAPVMVIQPIRFYIVYFLLLAILTSLFLERAMKTLTGVSKQMIFLILVVGLFAAVGFTGRASEGADAINLTRLSDFRQGMAQSADSGFAKDVDISTPGRAIAFLPIGVSYLMFSPFPWQFTSLRATFALPEMILWWLLIPSLIRGIRFTLKTRFSEASPILIFAMTLTAAYSLMHGNVGSGFRQRAQIFVFLFIFTSLGQWKKVCQRRRIDERLLLGDALPSEPPEETEPRAAPERPPTLVVPRSPS